MAAQATQNQNQGKASKKKARSAENTKASTPAAPSSEKDAAGEDLSEHPTIRELLKTIRNVNKKITNASKTDAVIAEHAGKSLEELVAARVINADQRIQILKKPGLQSQLAQLEESVAQLRKLESDYRTRFEKELADREKTLKEEFEAEKAKIIEESKEKAAVDSKSSLRESLVSISQFLNLAAARRTEETDPNLDENQALEGVLLAVYSGGDTAVGTMMKLAEGTDETTANTAGEPLETTFAQIKAAAQAYRTAFEAETNEQTTETTTDPTLAHATVNELVNGEAAPLTNGTHIDPPSASAPVNGTIGSEAGNAAAESQWDPDNETNGNLSTSQEWVEVSHEAATEAAAAIETVPAPPAPEASATPVSTSPPVAVAAGTSWADEQPDVPQEATPQAEANDGFHQVQRNRGRGDREGNWRGRGRGEWRGRGGYRGEGRGRRGGPRGGHRGGAEPRGQRRSEES